MFKTATNTWWVFLIVCFTINATVYAQEPLLQHFTVKDGLASNTVYSAFQDSTGFIWFCTDQGISRFDGHSFDNFTSNDGLPDNEVFQAIEDPGGRIWLTSYNRKVCFICNGIVYNAANSALCRYIESDPLFQNIRQGEGHTAPKLLFEGFQNLSKRLMLYAYASAEEVVHLYRKGNKNIFYTHGSICVTENDHLSTLKEKGKTPYCSNGIIYMSSSDSLISSTDIISWKSAAAATVYKSIPASKIYYITAKDDSTLWIGTNRGIWSCSRDLTRSDIRNEILLNKRVSCIKKDVDNNCWFTTLDDGVYVLQASQPAVYKDTNSAATSIATLPSQGLIIGNSTQYLRWVNNAQRTRYYPLGNFGNTSRVSSIMPFSDTHIIVGTDENLYAITIDAATNKTSRRILLKSSIKDLYRQNDSIFYACTSGAGGIDSNGKLHSYWSHRTTAIAVSGKRAWLGTLQGVYIYEPGKGIHPFKANTTLLKSRIVDIAVAPNKDVIFLTHQAGIFIWNGAVIQRIVEEDGLSNNICRKVLVDDQQRIWVSTNNGLDRLIRDKEEYRVSHFPLSNGLAENDIQDFTVKESNIYVCCDYGIVRLDTSQNQRAPPLRTVITSVTSGDSLFAFPNRISLSHKNAGITIKYTAILFGNSQNLTYRYILEGYNGDTVITKLASVIFDGMRPGHYVFNVWAKGSNNTWTREPAILSFIITPPFWYNAWFGIATLLTIGTLVYMLMKNRIHAIQKAERSKTALNKRMAELKMQALRAQINPHFIFNALNAIQNYYSINDERSANRYMTMFAKLIRQTLTHSKDNWISLAEEVSMLGAYIELEKMRFKNSFNYSINIASGIDTENTKIPAMMLQPFIENAIQHGLRHLRNKSGTLSVSFSAEPNGILCVIDDDGVGFAQSAALENKMNADESMGIDITVGRLETMNMLYSTNSTVHVIHKNKISFFESGTTVEVTLPLQPKRNG